MLAYLHRHINSVWLCLVALVLGCCCCSRTGLPGFNFCLSGWPGLWCATGLPSDVHDPFAADDSGHPVCSGGCRYFSGLLMLVFRYLSGGYCSGRLPDIQFPAFGGYDRLLEERYPKNRLLKKNMHGNRSFWIIAGWSFFPLVPTDLICYVAGMVRLPFRKVVGPLMVGEIPLVTIYVYLGSEFGDWLRI